LQSAPVMFAGSIVQPCFRSPSSVRRRPARPAARSSGVRAARMMLRVTYADTTTQVQPEIVSSLYGPSGMIMSESWELTSFAFNAAPNSAPANNQEANAWENFSRCPAQVADARRVAECQPQDRAPPLL
jgi:hypothetical protein